MPYFKQGSHDGLCGFYAVLNAFRHLQRATGHTFLLDDDPEFFDEAIECLARTPGVDMRILKGNPAVGGMDQFTIRDLCVLFAERIDLPIAIDIVGSRQRMPFARRYKSLRAVSERFAIIASHRDGTHWVAAVDHDADSYRLIDHGRSRLIALRGGDGPKLASDVAVVLIPR